MVTTSRYQLHPYLHSPSMAKRKRTQNAKRPSRAIQQREPSEEQTEAGRTESISVSRSPTPLGTEDCPFTIEYRKTSKRKRQASRRTTLSAFFSVQPRRQWHSLKSYKHFSVGRETFDIDDLVFVNNNEDNNEDETKFWVARVLEIRALDEVHVYIRVYWWYWPENLPMGRCAWHGNRELIASNHLEVIDAMSISGRADMRRWEELDEEEEGGDLFWRQTFDYLRGTLLVCENLQNLKLKTNSHSLSAATARATSHTTQIPQCTIAPSAIHGCTMSASLMI